MNQSCGDNIVLGYGKKCYNEDEGSCSTWVYLVAKIKMVALELI